MGVIKHFSSSSHDRSSNMFSKWKRSQSSFSNTDESKPKNLPNPDPNNYKILKSKTIGKFLIIEIQYLDCTNYEGKKILIFDSCDMVDLLVQKAIDPHFSDNKGFHSPIARFEPTEKGWVLAVWFCENIIK
jgi:hypothetical protein